MKLFLDTEFSSLLKAESQLISIALVAEDGREFYAERPPDSYRTSCTRFVIEIVWPALWGARYEMSAAQLATALREWLQGFDFVEIVTDAPSWDFHFLRDALDEPQLGWPPRVATRALYFTASDADIMAYFAQPGRVQHHALYDARALRLAYEMHPPKLPISR